MQVCCKNILKIIWRSYGSFFSQLQYGLRITNMAQGNCTKFHRFFILNAKHSLRQMKINMHEIIPQPLIGEFLFS